MPDDTQPTSQQKPRTNLVAGLFSLALIGLLTVGAIGILRGLRTPANGTSDTKEDAATIPENRQVTSPPKTKDAQPGAAEQHYNRGLHLQSQGKTDEAIAAYRQALQINPHFAEAHNNLAAELAMSGQQQIAIKHFQQVVEIKPDYAQGHFNLGNALIAANQLEQAIPHLRRAIEIDSQYAKAHNNLAVALKRTGQLNEAYRHMQEAIRLKRAEVTP